MVGSPGQCTSTELERRRRRQGRKLGNTASGADGLKFCLEDDGTSADAFYTTTLKTLEPHLQDADPLDEDVRRVLSLRRDSKYYIEYEGTWYDLEWETGYV